MRYHTNGIKRNRRNELYLKIVGIIKYNLRSWHLVSIRPSFNERWRVVTFRICVRPGLKNFDLNFQTPILLQKWTEDGAHGARGAPAAQPVVTWASENVSEIATTRFHSMAGKTAKVIHMTLECAMSLPVLKVRWLKQKHKLKLWALQNP